ncbi:hypothetical protein CALCODRAFT_510148 [Calocera cornea HHB12733]|uniref:Uncharacterized protein n=1 Tax=Calocera cornea HHB12733 TaxID=1353952 RepID=A0A165ESH5_9BASI|nr:hypothetical protein CALCODRAFT_510148 [Calocera cornea HHB12733]
MPLESTLPCENTVLRVENESDAVRWTSRGVLRQCYSQPTEQCRTAGLVKYEIIETIVIRPSAFTLPRRRFKYAQISLAALYVPLGKPSTIISVPIVFSLHNTGIAEVFAIPLYSYIQGPYADYMLDVHVHQDQSKKMYTQQYHVISEYRTTKPSGPVPIKTSSPSNLREWLGGVIVLRYTRRQKEDINSLDYGNVTESDIGFLERLLSQGDPTTPLTHTSLLNEMLHRSCANYMMSM